MERIIQTRGIQALGSISVGTELVELLSEMQFDDYDFLIEYFCDLYEDGRLEISRLVWTLMKIIKKSSSISSMRILRLLGRLSKENEEFYKNLSHLILPKLKDSFSLELDAKVKYLLDFDEFEDSYRSILQRAAEIGMARTIGSLVHFTFAKMLQLNENLSLFMETIFQLVAILQEFEQNEEFKRILSRMLDYEEFIMGNCSNLMLNAISYCRRQFSIGDGTEAVMTPTFPELLVNLEHPATYYDSLLALNNFISNITIDSDPKEINQICMIIHENAYLRNLIGQLDGKQQMLQTLEMICNLAVKDAAIYLKYDIPVLFDILNLLGFSVIPDGVVYLLLNNPCQLIAQSTILFSEIETNLHECIDAASKCIPLSSILDKKRKENYLLYLVLSLIVVKTLLKFESAFNFYIFDIQDPFVKAFLSDYGIVYSSNENIPILVKLKTCNHATAHEQLNSELKQMTSIKIKKLLEDFVDSDGDCILDLQTAFDNAGEFWKEYFHLFKKSKRIFKA